MSYSTHNKTLKVSAIFLFSLFVISGLAILSPTVLIAPTPTVFAIAEEQKLPKLAPLVVKVLPQAHLKIPEIGVDAVIKNMGLTSAGAMAVPSNGVDVGWFSLGTRPGQTGSAVIGAHNIFDSKAGVFARLDQLKVGDVLSVVDAKGVSISFVVSGTRVYDATDTNSGIFQSDSGVHLNLITCVGVVDPITKSSTKRLVIFTDAVLATNKIAIASVKTF
jgi:LPXTG-site transpeptidase (sortase) family protein